jgi:hypothetical protein
LRALFINFNDSAELLSNQTLSFLRIWRVKLSKDFYRPTHSGELFESLFRGEIYDPFYSKNKIHNVVHRLKEQLDKDFPYLKIDFRKNGYDLLASDGAGIKVYKNMDFESGEQILIRRFKQTVARAYFKRDQLAKSLNISKSNANSILNFAIQQKLVKKIGSGAGTTYRFLA